MKRKILIFLSFCLLLTSITMTNSNTINASLSNKRVHHNEGRKLLLDDVKRAEEKNKVEIEESKDKLRSEEEIAQGVVEELKDSAKEADIVEQLEEAGYELDKEISSETTKVLKNGRSIKVIAFREGVKQTKRKIQQVIGEKTPYRYNQDGVELEYYVKNTELKFYEEIDGTLVYKSDKGFVMKVETNESSTVFSHIINNSEVVIENAYKIKSNHQFKLDETSEGSTLNIYDGDELVTRFFVVSTFDYLLSQEDEEQTDFVDYEFEIDEETDMVNIKIHFDDKIPEGLKGDSEYVVELATFENVVETKERYLRGTRQNGEDFSYPHIPGISDVAMGGANEPFKVRVGKNIESFSGEFSSLNAGYYEDKTDYNEVLNSLGVATRLIDANLKMYLIGPPKGSGGYLTNKEFFELNCAVYGTMCNVPEYAKEGTYIINAMYGEYNPRQITYNNVIEWDRAGKINYEAAGLSNTTLNYDQATSTWIDFDVSHAVGGWLRNDNQAQQLLQINNFGPDNYFATQALGNGNNAAYIELTLEELPDFEANPYPMEKTEVNVRSFTRNDHNGAITNVAIGIDGLTTMDALVKYEVYEVESGEVIEEGSTEYGAQNTYKFPMYLTELENINNYYIIESNYQVEKLISTQDLDMNKVYGVRVMPYFKQADGSLATDKGEVIDEDDDKYWYEGDTFQLYKVGYKYEILYRILNYYGRDTKELREESYFDNNMHNHLISEGNKLFIRNPSKHAGEEYVQTSLTEVEEYLIDQGLMGMGYECEFGFEPINFNTGNFVYSSKDALVHSKGKSIGFTRYYNALEDAAPGSFGRNWSSTIDYRMQILYNGSVVFKDESGTGHVITKNEDESYNKSYTGYSYEREVARVEEKLIDSGYYAPIKGESAIQTPITVKYYNHIFTSKSGDKYYFNDDLMLEKIVNYDGDVHKFVNGFYGVEKYILPDGKEINFVYNNLGFVERVKFEDGTDLAYKYDKNENLISSTDQSGVKVKYNYNSKYGKHLMTSYESNGVKFITNEYDSEKRVAKQIDANGNVSKLSYKSGYTKLTDNNGNEFEVHYNELGHTTKVVENGYRTEKIYDENMQVVQKNEIDENGNKLSTYFEYNEEGQIIKTVYPTGEEATFEYDGYNLVKSTTPEGTNEYLYDDNNQLLESKNNGASKSSNVYDEAGNLLSKTNEHGGVTRYTYYPDNNIHTVTSPLGNTVTYEYDQLGFMTKKTTELGQVIKYEKTLRNELSKVIYSDNTFEMYEYDDFGRMIAKQDRDGVTFNYEYDQLGNLTKIITPYYEIKRVYDGNGNLIEEIDGNGNSTKYEYNHNDQLIKTIHPSGLEEETVYDEENNILLKKDNLGVIEENEYDGFNNLIKSNNLGNISKNKYSNNKLIATFENDILQQSYTYDEKGELKETISSTGVVSSQEKDALGILRSSSDGLNTNSYEYDKSGNAIKITNSLGHIVKKEYGAYNLVTSTTDADGVRTEFKYDQDGKEIERKVGNIIVEKTTYTPAGRVKVKTDGNGNETSYYYDALGRVDYIIRANGGVNDYNYDNNNNVIEYVDALGNVTKYEYDSVNQKVLTINAEGNKFKSEYDLRGNLIKETREDSRSKHYEYNLNNKLIKEVDYNGVETIYTYDKKNRLIKTTKSTGEKVTTAYDKYGRSLATTSYEKTNEKGYDIYNRNIKEILVDGREKRTEYDELGRVVKTVNEYGEAVENQYSPAGKLKKVIYEDGSSELFEHDVFGNTIKSTDRAGNEKHLKYDNNSNVIAEIDANGNAITKEYNSINKVVKSMDALGNATVYRYDANGNEYEIEDALGNKTTRQYDSMNRVVSEVDALNYELKISYDELGRIKRVKRKDGVVEKYKYDVNGNEVEKKVGFQKLYKKQYNLKNELISEVDGNGNKVKYYYDEEGRLVKTVEANGNEIVNKYDKYGNLLSSKDSIGKLENNSYDKHHRLISKEDSLGNTTQYNYEEKGTNLLSEKFANGNEKLYEYDVLDREVKSVNEKTVVTQSKYDAVGNIIEITTDGAVVLNKYDANNNLVETVDELGVSTYYKYDALNRNTTIIDGNKNEIYNVYDELGRVVEEGINKKAIKQMTYNAYTVISEEDANGSKNLYEYDNLGNVIKSKQNDELITNYKYDNNNNLLKVIKNSEVIQEYKYDNMNNNIYFENTESIKHKYEYDARNRMTKEISHDGSIISYEYDNANNIVKEVANDEKRIHTYNQFGFINSTKYIVDEEILTTTINYDEYNRIVEVMDPNENSIKYEYDKLDRRIGLTYSDGSIQKYQYNEKGYIVSTTTRDDIEIGITYDNNYNIIREDYSNGVNATFKYNENNQPLELKYNKGKEVVEKSIYEYDAGGRVLTNNREVDGKSINKAYEYDQSNQISKVDYKIIDGMINSKITYEYQYDKLNNRNVEKVITDGKEEVYIEQTNKVGQIISRTGNDEKISYEYDANGNLIEEVKANEIIGYEYNEFGKLSSTYKDDLKFEDYKYDGFGNRIGKITYDYYSSQRLGGRVDSVISLEGSLSKASEDGLDCSKGNKLNTLESELSTKRECDLGNEEYSGVNKLKVEYVNDITYENALVLEVREESIVYNTYAYDRPVTSTINEDVEVNVLSKTNSINARIGKEVQVHEYEVNGKELEVVNDFEIINELGYNGEVEDNIDLQYLRARYYKQDTSRFISEDTYRGEVGRGQSHNTYIYVENDGVNNVDRSGERPEQPSDAVLNRGPGYIVYSDGQGGYVRKVTDQALYSAVGHKVFEEWLATRGDTKSAEDQLAESGYTPNSEPGFYTGIMNLNPDDPQFVEKVIMCDRLEDNGLSTSDIKYLIHNVSLEQLNEFLDWLEENPNGTFNEWQGIISSGFLDGLKERGSDYLSILSSKTFWALLVAAITLTIGISATGLGIPLIVFMIIDTVLLLLGIGMLIYDVIKLKSKGYSNDYIAGYLAPEVAMLVIDAVLVGVSIYGVYKGAKIATKIGRAIKSLTRSELDTLLKHGDKIDELVEIARASGKNATEVGNKLADITAGIKNGDSVDDIAKKIGLKSGGKIGDNFDDLYKAMYKHEQGMVDDLLSQGKNVELIDANSGRTFDALVNGVPTELKFASGTEDSAIDLVSKGFKQLPPGEGNVIINITQSQATRESLLARLAGKGYDTSRIIIID